jgi:hypothetical protein
VPNEVVVVLQGLAGTPSATDACAALEDWARARGLRIHPQPFEDPGARRFAYLTIDRPAESESLLRELRALPYVEAAYSKPRDEPP